jgi:hypothetical protein
MTLGGLSPGEVARMMTAVLGAEPDERLARVVHDRTAGNPFFVVELLRLLGSEGRLGGAPPTPRRRCHWKSRPASGTCCAGAWRGCRSRPTPCCWWPPSPAGSSTSTPSRR